MKTIICLCFLFLCNFTIASTLSKEVIGKIIKIKGEGFITQNGKTKAIKTGDDIYNAAEIAVEHDGYISFQTFETQNVHMGKATSVSVTKSGIVLRQGEIWVQGFTKDKKLTIESANAFVSHSGAEGIIIYDSLKAKTQVVTLNGMFSVANTRAKDVAISIGEGNFTYVDNTYENGIPRDPTPVGDQTNKELMSHFNYVSPVAPINAKVTNLDHEKAIPHSNDVHHDNEKHNEIKISEKGSADEMLDAYKDILLSNAEYKNSNNEVIERKKSRSIASVQDTSKKKISKKKQDVKIFGATGEKTMSFGEEFFPKENSASASMRGPASFSAPEVEKTKAGDTKVLEDHHKETKKLIDEIGNL